MKNLSLPILLLSCLIISIYACKKEDVNTPEFVKSHFVGKWPLKQHIEIVRKNNVIISNDTTKFSPIDTLVYTADGKYTKAKTTVNYTIDEAGQHITYATSPETTWDIKYLRITSIILTRGRTETVGNDIFTYYTEEQLIK
jgi:hypothetical protein